jgi:two-component system sensor histidine kinase BaeS
MGPTMNSLFTKILLALGASTVLALLLTTVISRAVLHRGFMDFLEQQEERQILALAPELASFYRNSSGWHELENHPRRWMRLLAQSRKEGFVPPAEAAGEPGGPGRAGPPGSVRQLWQRLFLLDQDRQWIAGAQGGDETVRELVPVSVDGVAVGWLGFLQANEASAPEARRFLTFQTRALLLSLLLGLLLASALAWLLARHLSRPVTRLRDTVQQLTRGNFDTRASVDTGDEIGDLARNMNQLAETLQKNETMRRRWTADVAHELRTPLSILQGELEAVHDGVRPYTPALLDSLQEEVSHLAQLVEDLQTLALADAGALNVRLQPTDLAELTRQALAAFEVRIAAAGLALETALPDQLTIMVDAQRLRQLLHNLLENSCRYTYTGGRIRVRLDEQPGYVILVIEDSAPGPDALQRAQLFERFYRAEPSRGRLSGGSGLGLAICRNLVEAHGGEICAEQSPLGGLLIRVRLPRD